MGVLAWLLGLRKKNVAKSTDSSQSDIGERSERQWIHIPERDFYGQRIRSANKRYALAWIDGNDPTGEGGAGTRGRYLFFDKGKVVVDRRMDRPNDGKIAENGVFILNDWSARAKLSGVFRAFDSGGNAILAQKFDANLFNNGLSKDGRFAACHTANSDSEKDSAVLTTFDLEKRIEIARWHAPSGWPMTCSPETLS